MANGTTVAAMISVVTGRRMTKHDAWVWLLEESEDFISKIVTKDRVKSRWPEIHKQCRLESRSFRGLEGVKWLLRSVWSI